MIHPFAHMNSVFAAERLQAERGAATAARRRDFAALLEAKARAEPPAASAMVERQPVEASSGAVPEVVRRRGAPPPETRTGPPVDTPVARESSPPGRRVGPPSFEDVPDSVKWPSGPYRQAPAEYGGQWWLVNPFTGPEPWIGASPSAALAAEDDRLPPGFREVFGDPPRASENRGSALTDWLRNLEHFQGVGVPDGFTLADVELAGDVFEAWGMARPVFYNGRYGWRAAFVDDNGERFEASAFTSLAAPHLIVARRQIRQIGEGLTPATLHPFVPPGVSSAARSAGEA